MLIQKNHQVTREDSKGERKEQKNSKRATKQPIGSKNIAISN